MAYCVNGCWTVSNRIGIGTETPSTALHIVGVHTSGLGIINAISSDSSILNLDSATADARVRLKYQGGERWFAGMNDTAFNYHIQNGNNGCINLAVSYATGYVGIGTCDPAGKLHVQNGQIRIHGAPSDAITGTQGYYLANTGNNEAYNWQMSCNFNLGLWTFSSTAGGGWGLRGPVITQSGNVGIGCNNPQTRLHVTDQSGYGIATFDSRTEGGYLIFQQAGATKAYIQWGLTVAGSSNGNYMLVTNDAICGSIALQTKSPTGTIYSSALVVGCTGNVGIGTCSPSTRLAVEGSGTDIETVARFNNQVNCTTRVWLRNSSHSAYWGLSSTATADTLATGMVSGAMTMGFGNNYPIQFWNGSTATVKMTIGSDGNVGINTTTPGTYKLNVNGAFYAAGSSCEYKQSICQYNTDSCMFMKLKPVTYQYKDEWCHLGKELKSGTQIGLIAEDVAEVYPELAILKDEDDIKIVRNVDYEKLSIVLLSEVQKLRKELDELKTK